MLEECTVLSLLTLYARGVYGFVSVNTMLGECTVLCLLTLYARGVYGFVIVNTVC
jgi:hypothetical protein